ncbi:MAG: hypothetical protein JWO69_882 [Thermoleophilia bacterium]|nr:hypothetical protein [Thermoleophilia bacterium]
MKYNRVDRERASGNGAMGGAYFLGLIGAAVYYIHQADTFGEGLIGMLKAFVWPAFLVYHVFEHVG